MTAIQNSSLPTHIAIIMDGNGRWASGRKLPKKMGHKKGAATAKQVALDCKDLGVKYLTLYAFSSENWQRPQDEVEDLMNLLREYLKNDAKELIKHNVRLKFIGNIEALDDDLQEAIKKAEEESKHHQFTLVLAISYGGRDEIRNAAMKFALDVQNDNVPLLSENFDKYLYTADIPDPDLFIRTSGEHRVSNFLLWQIAYSELYFTNVLWPDFDKAELIKAIESFSLRDRRYGR